MVTLSVVAVLILFSGLRKIRAAGEWSRTATFGAVIIVTTTSLVEVAVTYLGKWTKVRNAYKTVTWVKPDLAHQANRLILVLLAVSATAVFVVMLKRRGTLINLPAVLFMLIEVVSAESALLHGDNPFRPFSLVFLTVVLACTVAPRGLGIHIGVGTACTIAAIASGFTFLIQRDFSVFSCSVGTFTSDKCGLFDFDFRGTMENENALAMYLALAMPFVYLGFGSWEGPALSGYILCLALMTGGRSGMTAAAVTFLALLVFRPNVRRGNAAAPVRNALLYAGLGAMAVIGFVTPFLTTDPDAYHGRAALWIMAREALTDPATLIHGTGMYGWQHVRDSGMIDPSASYSVHNQWLQVLFSTGLLGLVLYLAALGVLIWQSRRGYSLVIGCVLLPVFMLSLTERPWPLDFTDWLTWACPAALLSYPAVRRLPRSTGREDVSQPQSGHTVAELVP